MRGAALLCGEAGSGDERQFRHCLQESLWLFKMGYLETRGDGERVNYITRLDNLEQVFHWVAEYIGGIG